MTMHVCNHQTCFFDSTNSCLSPVTSWELLDATVLRAPAVELLVFETTRGAVRKRNWNR